ncbi:MAG: BT4734/BF3469 family protein [Rikenellaceae bacterium]
MTNEFSVSVFQNIRNSRVPMGTQKIDEVLRSQKYKEVIEVYRSLDKNDPDAVDIKTNILPAYTVSGEFATRCKDGLIRHSGLICLDFDNVSDPEALKRSFEDILFIKYAALSVSGRGVFAIIEIADPTKHSEYFRAMIDYFAKRGIEVDKQCGDVSRLRVASYDPAPYINDNAIEWDILPKATPKPTPKQVRYTPCDGCNFSEKLFFVGLEFIEKYAIDITAIRSNWLAIGSFIKSQFGEVGRSLFHRVSRFHSGYNAEACDRLYNGCAESGYDIGVFSNACSRASMPRLKELYFDKKGGFEL